MGMAGLEFSDENNMLRSVDGRYQIEFQEPWWHVRQRDTNGNMQVIGWLGSKEGAINWAEKAENLRPDGG